MIKIAIFGVGLMGGSLALCFKGKPDVYVVGHSNNPLSVDKYLKSNVVDHATTSMQEAADNADYIFLCVPVGQLEHYFMQMNNLKLKTGCIITDVGSTKASIAAFADQVSLKGAYFIGGHPMAGSERSGVEAATEHLYENAFYVLTPSSNVPPEVYDRLVELLSYTKANIIRLDAESHDEIVGAISHLPHMIAVALVNQIADYNESNDLYQILAAGGFRDITRIASSDPIIWRDILLNNKNVVLKLLKDWSLAMNQFKLNLEANDGGEIERQFEKARSFRSKLPERRKGMLNALFDIYVDVPDHPGIIGQITTLLGSHRVNLSNIQIIESREDVPGVLRLSFHNELAMDLALALLKPEYSIHL
jgi:prephenate dehydrogenase